MKHSECVYTDSKGFVIGVDFTCSTMEDYKEIKYKERELFEKIDHGSYKDRVSAVEQLAILYPQKIKAMGNSYRS